MILITWVVPKQLFVKLTQLTAIIKLIPKRDLTLNIFVLQLFIR